MAAQKFGVNGSANITAGGSVNILNVDGSYTDIAEIFASADASFRTNVEESGILFRGDQEVVFSAEKLFSSLMQIGLPFEASIRIPFQIVPVLANLKDAEPDKTFTTSDIRVAVVHCIDGLVYQDHTVEEVNMWASAYIRRFGNPNNDYLMVIDNGEERPLNHEYAQSVLIPHLLRRIIGAEECNAPEEQFPEIFSTTQMDRMSREILKYVTALNVYCVRYKTLLYLLQDLVLEPPHPWIVSKESKATVANYNIRNADHHLLQLGRGTSVKNPALFNQSARECFMHLSAAILSHYGAFLGVSNRYGFLELIRLLKLRKSNLALWSYCAVREIEGDLRTLNCTVGSLLNRLERIMHNLNAPDGDAKYAGISLNAAQFAEIVVELCPGYEASAKLRRSLSFLRGPEAHRTSIGSLE
jgi:hypothetical protein